MVAIKVVRGGALGDIHPGQDPGKNFLLFINRLSCGGIFTNKKTTLASNVIHVFNCVYSKFQGIHLHLSVLSRRFDYYRVIKKKNFNFLKFNLIMRPINISSRNFEYFLPFVSVFFLCFTKMSRTKLSLKTQVLKCYRTVPTSVSFDHYQRND